MKTNNHSRQDGTEQVRQAGGGEILEKKDFVFETLLKMHVWGGMWGTCLVFLGSTPSHTSRRRMKTKNK
jgi:hypothetical protein